MGSLEFAGGKAEITEVTRCSGDVSGLYINYELIVEDDMFAVCFWR